MKRKGNATVVLISIIIVAVIALAIVSLRYLGLFSLTGDPEHQVSSMGENWTIAAPFGNSGYVCPGAGQLVTTDNSDASHISVTSQEPNSGSLCGGYNARVTIKLETLDLCSASRTVIHRNVEIKASGNDRPGLSYTLLGQTGGKDTSTLSTRAATLTQGLGDVIATNTGSSLKIEAAEFGGTPLILPLTDCPVRFQSSASANGGSSSPWGSYVKYTITGIDTTPFSTTSTTPVVTNTTTTVTPTPEAPAALPWYARAWAWLKDLFGY